VRTALRTPYIDCIINSSISIMSEESSAGSRELALLKRLPASLRHDFVETLSHEASGAALLASCENMDASGTEAENKASTQTTTKGMCA
jgi:hypothetical protein